MKTRGAPADCTQNPAGGWGGGDLFIDPGGRCGCDGGSSSGHCGENGSSSKTALSQQL